MPVQNQNPAESPEKGLGCLSALTRLFWMFGGTIILIYCLVYMLLGRATSAVDLIYIFAVISLVIVRYFDIKLYKGEKLNGQPASMSHWLRYSLVLLLGAGILFAAARAFARLHFL